MKIRIEIDKTVKGSSESYAYPVDMNKVRGLKYASDMSFCIAESAEVLPGTRLATEQDEWKLQAVEERRIKEQLKNKQACQAHILARYPDPIQRSAALGIYPSAVVTEMTDFIAACIAEENRVFDMLETADSPETVEKPVWPEVTK